VACHANTSEQAAGTTTGARDTLEAAPLTPVARRPGPTDPPDSAAAVPRAAMRGLPIPAATVPRETPRGSPGGRMLDSCAVSDNP